MKSYTLYFLCLMTLDLQAETHKIEQKDKNFNVSEITIRKGDTIEFVNLDETTHHIMFKTEDDKISHKQPQGSPTFKYQFKKEDTISVRCAIHPKMKLEVKVESKN